MVQLCFKQQLETTHALLNCMNFAYTRYLTSMESGNDQGSGEGPAKSNQMGQGPQGSLKKKATSY